MKMDFDLNFAQF